MYVECTDSSFAVNRDNWVGVVDEGEEYIPANEMVVYDVSYPFSVQRYEIPEMFGISTTHPTPSPSIRWIAAPIIVFVLLLALAFFLLFCAFTFHLIPVNHNADITHITPSDTESLTLPPRQTDCPSKSVTYVLEDCLETENLKGKEEEEGGGGEKMGELRGG